MSGDRLLSVEEARERVFAAIAGPTRAEVAWLSEALGRVAAARVTSPIALPPWDNSAMDGYAIRAGDVADATEDAPTTLEVIGEVRGRPGARHRGPARHGDPDRDRCARPARGRRRHPGRADHAARRDGGRRRSARPGRDRSAARGDRASTRPVPAGGSIRRRAATCRRGRRSSSRARSLTPAVIGLAAGVGRRDGRRPSPAARRASSRPATRSGPAVPMLGPAGIPDANGPALMAMVEAAGGDPDALGIAADRFDDVRARLCAGLVDGADAIIVSGGVSVGPYDVVRAAFEEFGEIDLWRVAVQPGKPFAFGTARAPGDDGTDPDRPPTLLFGLPGNPVSTFVTFELFVRPASAAARRPSRRRAVPADRPRRARRRRHESRPADVASSASRPSATSAGTPRRDDRGRVRSTWPAARAGRGVTCCRPSRRPTRWRSSRGRRHACRPAPRSSSGGSTGPDASTQRSVAHGPLSSDVMDPKAGRTPAPRAERRRLSHVDRSGRPRMVDVCGKPVTARRAVAEAMVSMSHETLSLVIDGGGAKGDVLGVAELAGVMGAKRTSELIPLCHPLALTDLAGRRSRPTARPVRCASGPRPRRPARPASRWRR